MKSALWMILRTAHMLSLLLFFAATFHSGHAYASETDDPISGTWLLSPTLSTHSDQTQSLERAFARYESKENGAIRFTSEIHKKDGTIIRRGWTAMPDGNDHPVSGDPGFDTIALRRVNSHTILFLYKKEGRIISAQVREVSADLKSMTLIQLGIGTSGNPINNTVIFNRE